MTGIRNLLINFTVGGAVTALIVKLEQSGHRTLSVVATLVPAFTLISFFFIGQSEGGLAVSQYSKLVLIGTIVTWVPYIAIVAWLAPSLGPNRAIAAGLGTFFILVLGFVSFIERQKLFQ